MKGAKRGGKKEDNGKSALAIQDGTNGSDESRAIALLVFVKNLGASWSDEVSRLAFL